jgi:DNA replication protein DnaC
MINETLENYYARIRAEERASLEKRIEQAYLLAPHLKELDKKRASLFSEIGNRTISADQAKQQLESISQEEKKLLASIGLHPSALLLQYRCASCQDTGFVGTTKKPCSCRLLLREKLRGSDGINDREIFQNFSEDIYLSTEQKKRTLAAKTVCENYANSLPCPKQPNVLLMGSPGLGKSFLGNAIAHSAIERGIESLRITAYAFTQKVFDDIRNQTEHVKLLHSISLLVLDDLGSEPIIPNVSTEWLFAVINERVLQNLPTVCITNLDLRGLQAKYGERLASRLYDVNTTLVLHLTGENLRTVR